MGNQDQDQPDFTGISKNKLNFGLWYVENRNNFRGIITVFLILFSSVTLIYGLYGFIYYYGWGVKQDQAMVLNAIQAGTSIHDYVLGVSAKPLQYSATKIFKSGDAKYDFLSEVTNLNDQYYASFDYYFLVSGVKTKTDTGFILPGEKKYLTLLALDYPSRPDSAEIYFENLKWQRIDAHQIPNWKQYQDDRLNINISNTKFSSASASGLSEKLNLSSVSFDIYNETAFSYWNADFIIALNGSYQDIIGVTKYSVSQFLAGQKRHIEFTWPNQFGSFSNLEITPMINIMDSNNYIRYGL
jgi:hypothetical protein